MALRFAYTSDIHIEYHLEAAGLIAGLLAEQKPDIFAVAGDVSPAPGMVERTLSIFSEVVPTVLFVPGNHDLWCRSHRRPDFALKGPDSRRRYEVILKDSAERGGAVYLPASPYIHEGVGFAGVTGWYDWTLRNRELDHVLSPDILSSGKYDTLQWMDCVCSYWKGEGDERLSPVEITAFMVERLERSLNFLDSRADRIIVITHFLPYNGLVEPSGDPRHDFVLAHAGSERLGEVINGHPKVVRVVSGHIHTPIKKRVGANEVLFETSPVGYPREMSLPLFEHIRGRMRVVDI